MKAFTFSDVLIVPCYSAIQSRGDVDTDVKVKDIELNLPVVSSNMKTITGPNMVTAMDVNGGMGILHRFNTIEEAVDDFKQALLHVHNSRIGVSIGVKDREKLRANALYCAGAKLFCIDVAHGHHALVGNMIKWLRDQYQDQITIIAGNVATYEGTVSLFRWGADIVKVGIGPGSVCRTRKNVGVGVPQLYALQEARRAIIEQGIKGWIIGDGGIRDTGDIPKALKYADLVMVGNLFSGTSETPGKVFRNANGQHYKTYGGSASGESKGENRFVEGIVTTVPFKGHVKFIIREIKESIQTACSYVGAKNLGEFKEYCEFIEITDGGRVESNI